MLANLFRRFDVELWETDRGSIDCVIDSFAPRGRVGNQGVRVLVR